MPVPSELNCDFCTNGAPSTVYLVPGFSLRWKRPDPALGSTFTSEAGGWAACSVCRRLIDHNRLNALVDRTTEQHQRRWPVTEPDQIAARRSRMLQLYGTILRLRSDALACDDPRVAPLMHPSLDAPIGHQVFATPDGSTFLRDIAAVRRLDQVDQ